MSGTGSALSVEFPMAGVLGPDKEWFVPLTLSCRIFVRIGVCITVCKCTIYVWFDGNVMFNFPNCCVIWCMFCFVNVSESIFVVGDAMWIKQWVCNISSCKHGVCCPRERNAQLHHLPF